MVIFEEIPHDNGIILSQKEVQAKYMNPLCIHHCRSKLCLINLAISLYKHADIISFFFMGLLYGAHMDPSGQPAYGPTHMRPM